MRFRANSASRPVVLGSHRKPEAVLMPYRQFLSLQRAAPTTPPVRELLDRKRDLIARLARLNRLASVAVFGSVARGDDTDTSDIDLLVDPDEDASLYDIAQFAIDMEQLLGRPVDVISRRTLDPTADQAILAEAQPL
jgi:predicted nucleotidyltransferase